MIEPIPLTVGQAAHYITLAQENGGYDHQSAERLLRDTLAQLGRPLVLVGLDIDGHTPPSKILTAALVALDRLDDGSNDLILNTFGPETGRFVQAIAGRRPR